MTPFNPFPAPPVLAGAGTGKTRVVTVRIANLIRHRVRSGANPRVSHEQGARMQARVTSFAGQETEREPRSPRFTRSASAFSVATSTTWAIPRVSRSTNQETRRVWPGRLCGRFACRNRTRPGDLLNLIAAEDASIVPSRHLARETQRASRLDAYRRYQDAEASGALTLRLLLCTDNCSLNSRSPPAGGRDRPAAHR